MQPGGGQASTIGQAREHHVGQLGDIFAPFTQRRHAQFDNVEPVVEILAETASRDFGCQILVGGAEDAYIDHHFLLATDGAHGFFLNRAQQFDLHRQRQVGDFVEEQGAAIGRLEQPLLVFDGAGEAAFLVTEELALHQLRGNSAAVDRYERLFDARALLMDQACDQFLAAARFAADVDRRLAAREFLDLLAQRLHRRRVAEQAAVDRGFLAFGGANAQGSGDQFAQATEVHRFGEKVEGAGLERVDRGVQAAVGGDHRHGNLRVALLDVLHQIQAGAIGQAHIGEAQVERLACQPLARFLDVAGAAGVQLHASEGDFQQLADIGFVVDDQGSLTVHAQLSLRGWAKVMRKQLPPPSRGL
ncbi:hypothetical protein N619_28195 [Ectopseudomonas oleovorans]|nr:hypothetical protein N619_28195 [Pseudomonas oleovorans]